MTLAEEFFKKATEEIDYDLDDWEELSEMQHRLQSSLAWDASGENWTLLEERITDAYKSTMLTERILEFKDSSFLEVSLWSNSYGDGGIGDIRFRLVEPYQEMTTKYREIQ